MLRRLYHDQPESFAFTPANQAWAEAQIKKYPEGRQQSAIIPLLWRAQEQEGWLTRPAIEDVAEMLGIAYIRALEVATFYFMFQLQPVGSVAHVQVCGTLSCMICGAEDLIGVCKEKIADNAHEVSADGKFSWEEVECLGACVNAPMMQMNGLFKLSCSSFWNHDRPVPRARHIVEVLLGLVDSDGGFGDNCEDYNAVMMLAKLCGQEDGYRAGDILTAMAQLEDLPSAEERAKLDSQRLVEILRDSPQAPELLRFSISEQYLSLRRDLQL